MPRINNQESLKRRTKRKLSLSFSPPPPDFNVVVWFTSTLSIKARRFFFRTDFRIQPQVGVARSNIEIGGAQVAASFWKLSENIFLIIYPDHRPPNHARLFHLCSHPIACKTKADGPRLSLRLNLSVDADMYAQRTLNQLTTHRHRSGYHI